MKSAILEKGEKYYTNLSRVFKSIENEQLKYNWLITDCVCYPNDEKLEKLFLKEYIWLSGEELTKIAYEEEFQFIWGVFSGFLKEINIEEVLKYELPFADGYGGFWVDNVGIQHPLASVEIVAWDGDLTLLISKDDTLIDKFRASFPLSEDLLAKNTREHSEIAHIEELLIRELTKGNIDINEKILHQKSYIWRELYGGRKILVKDEDILECITKRLPNIL